MNNNNNYYYYCIFIFISLSICHVNTLHNGQALTPPMGWSSWWAYGCKNKCVNGDLNCLCETEIRGVAIKLYNDGYVDAGYKYIILDDCWQYPTRDENGRLRADPSRFPRGIKDLVQFLKSYGLKLGLFSDIGPYSGGRNPGTQDHLKIDAETFNDWGVEYVKMSGYTADPRTMDDTYPEFGSYLETSITYACSWPYYQGGYYNNRVDFTKIKATCNTWRIDNDVSPNWNKILDIINNAKDNQRMSNYVEPGSWIDLDLLVMGYRNYFCFEQTKTQMVVWTMLASPLIFTHNVFQMQNDERMALQDPQLIAINQDRLGRRGRYLRTVGSVQIWTREISSERLIGGIAYALAFVNLNNYEVRFKTQLGALELGPPPKSEEYIVRKIWGCGANREEYLLPFSDLTMTINAYGTNLYRVEPVARYDEINYAIAPYEKLKRRSSRRMPTNIIDDIYH